MTLPEFKFIYLVEYFHRLWGRAMGLALLVPTIYAAIKYRSLLPRLLLIWALAGAQGFLGWYMVKSGLVDDPQVSPFRLTTHLLLALAILCVILKTVFDLTYKGKSTSTPTLQGPLAVLTLSLVLTICFGGLTAGTHAGWIYNTFPLMNGHFFPEEILTISPFWLDILQNPATIQFIHRVLAFTSLALGFYVFLNSRQKGISSKLQHVCLMIAVALGIQVLLGVITLVLQVPIWLGVAHQMWASVTLSATFWAYLLSRGQVVKHTVAHSNA